MSSKHRVNLHIPKKNGLLIAIMVLLSMNLLMKFNESMTKTSLATSTPHPLAQLLLPKKVTTVFLNIGTNLSPILPPEEFGDTAIAIAFEPIVGCEIKPHEQLMVVKAAVAAVAGLTSMFVYNWHGLSSSLSKPSGSARWNTNEERGDGTTHLVPVITVKQILDAVPSHISIPYIRTDMQGYDFVAIEAAQDSLYKRKVDYLYTEVFISNPHYGDVNNDFCTEWWPHMKKMKYDLVFVRTPNKGKLTMEEVPAYCAQKQNITGTDYGDVLWKRHGVPDMTYKVRTHKPSE